MYLCSGGGECGGGSIRTSQPDDLMPRADELGDDSGADPAGRPGNEDTHENDLSYLTTSTEGGHVSCCHHSSIDVSS
jgi:hypothetical protein